MKQTPLKRKTPLRPKRRAKTHTAIEKEIANGRKPTRTQLIKLCDIQWGKLVKLHANGLCELCGKPGRDPHHMVSRRHVALRWAPENGVFLCCGCHLNFHHKESLTAWRFLWDKRPLSYEHVLANQYVTVHWGVADLTAILADLKAQVKEFE